MMSNIDMSTENEMPNQETEESVDIDSLKENDLDYNINDKTEHEEYDHDEDEDAHIASIKEDAGNIEGEEAGGDASEDSSTSQETEEEEIGAAQKIEMSNHSDAEGILERLKMIQARDASESGGNDGDN